MAEAVHWRAGQSVYAAFCLDREFAERLQVLMRPWLCAPCQSPRCTWSVSKSDKGWLLEEADGHQPHTFSNLDECLIHLEYHAVLRYHEDPGHTAIHASLLHRGRAAIMVVGKSESGKSTLSVALWQAGWQLGSDDCVLLDPQRYKVSPGPRRTSLRPGSRELLGPHLWSAIEATRSHYKTGKGLVFHPHELENLEPGGELDLTAVFILDLEHQPAEPSQKLTPDQALFTLLPYTTLAAREGLLAIPKLAPMLESIPAFRLRRDKLSVMVNEVNRNIQTEGVSYEQ